MRRVAITGFGIVSPIGVGREAFWDSLAQGRGGVAPITRFDASTFEVQLAGEVKESLPLPEPVASIAADDLKVGFAYAAAAEALAQAGVDSLGSDAILLLGTSLEVFDLNKVVEKGEADFKAVACRSLSGSGPALQIPLDTACRTVVARFDRPAEVLTNCSACSAGAQAIGHAYHAIRARRREVAVCGGFDSMINPLGVGGFQLLGALTTDNARGSSACRPFDATRNGTVLGEGAAVFVLEPLEQAEAAGKEILAELCGYGSTLDAYSLSAPDPNGDGAARAMLAALDDAGISASGIGHINAHVTGRAVPFGR